LWFVIKKTFLFSPKSLFSSPPSLKKQKTFLFFINIFGGGGGGGEVVVVVPLSIYIVYFLLKLERVISYCIQVTCEVFCSSL